MHQPSVGMEITDIGFLKRRKLDISIPIRDNGSFIIGINNYLEVYLGKGQCLGDGANHYFVPICCEVHETNSFVSVKSEVLGDSQSRTHTCNGF